MGKKEEVGQRIRVMRKSRHMTQEELAKAIGQSPSSITMYETGRRSPDYETLEAMADVFNVPLSSLLEEGVFFSTFEIKPIVVPDSERFVKLIHYMPESDYQMVMEAFAKAEQRMKEEEGESE